MTGVAQNSPSAVTSRALRRRCPAVRVQGIVRRELLGHVVVVVLRHRLESRRQRVEARGLRRELPRVGIGAAYDECQRAQRRLRELVLVQERVERAALAVVTELDVRDVVRDRALPLGDLSHLVARHEQKRWVAVDESADQPGACDAIDACLLSGDPFHLIAPLAYFWLLVWSSAAFKPRASVATSSV